MNCTAELGECELPEHTPELVSEFRFIPNQTEAMEFDIFQRWKEYRYLHAPLSWSDLLLFFCAVCLSDPSDKTMACLPQHSVPERLSQ